MIMYMKSNNALSLHMQYARADEVDKLRKDYEDGILALNIFMDTSNERMSMPVQVSFLNIRTFLQDIEVKYHPGDVHTFLIHF